MFYVLAAAFNQPIGHWDVTAVTATLLLMLWGVFSCALEGDRFVEVPVFEDSVL